MKTIKANPADMTYAPFLWAAQFVLAYLGPLFIVIVISGMLNTKGRETWETLEYVTFLLSGVLAALAVSTIMPEAIGSGRWVWVMPTALLALFVAWDMITGMRTAISADLFGTGEAWWIRALVTMPAWSCCWYSATMAWRVRRRHHSLSQTSVLHNPRRGMFEADILRETSSATLFTSAVGVRADQ